jgi:PAS domain S-box-containing protein
MSKVNIPSSYSNKTTLFIIFSIVSILIVISALFLYKNEKDSSLKRNEEILAALNDIKMNNLQEWLKERIAEAEFFSKNADLIENSTKLLTKQKNANEISNNLKTLVRKTKENHGYDNIVIYNKNANIIWSYDDNSNKIDDYTFNLISQLLQEPKITLSDFYFDEIYNEIHINIIAPIYNTNGELQSFLIFKLDPDDFLYPSLEKMDIPTKTGEVVLLKKSGNNLIVLNELRHQKNTALNLKIPLSKADDSSVKGYLDLQKLHIAKDYRNVPVLSIVSKLNIADWYLETKIDKDEVLAELNYREVVIFILAGLLILLLIIALVWYYNYQQKNLYQELFKLEKEKREKEEEFRIILYSIGDAVLITDKDGMVTKMNSAAEQLTGWYEREANGKPLFQIFNIINEQTREQIENPVQKVLEKGIVVGLANHTILISKDGKEYPIADSGSPIRNNNGEIIGVVLIFRDKTQEYLAEQKIFKSEARLNRAELVSKSGNWELHLTTQTIVGSLGAQKIYGVSDENLDYELIKNFPLPEYRQMMDEKLQRLINFGEPYDVEFKIKNAEGKILDIHSVATYDADNKILFGIIQDITEKKKIEKRKNQLAEIIEKSLNEIYIFDANTLLFEDINYEALNNLGYTIEEIKNLTPVDIKPEFTTSSFRETIKPLLEGKEKKLVFETVHQRKNGTTYPVEVNLQLLEFENKKVFLAVIIDITERKKAEEKILENEENFRLIFENSPIGIYIADTSGNILDGNKSLIEILGSPSLEATKQINVLTFPPLIKNGYSQKFKECVETGSTISIELSYTTNWGKTIILKSFIVPLKDKSGKVTKVYTLIEDVSERVKMTQELIYAKQKAEESDRLKSAFLANVSHEIRTPMNGILGFSQLLKDTNLSQMEQREFISIIEKSGIRMLNIINDIVDISKIESGQMKVTIVEFNINEQLRFVYNFFKFEVEQKGMSIQYNLGLPDKDANIATDKEKFYAIMVNLVKNSIKYSEKGTITIRYVVKEDTLEFAVSDEGIGIAEDKLDSIFDRFVQAEMELSRPYEGAGLGLSITKAYVEMLGGKIWVKSKLNEGSTFYFTLPFKQAKKDYKQIHQETTEQPNNKKKINKNLKVLIVEDDLTSEQLLTIELKNFAKEIIKAKTGTEAVEICRNNPDIDIVFMDIKLPEMNGYEATQKIREFNKNVKILAQTAYALEGDRENSLNSGCDEYISKPINRDSLFEILLKWFN